MPDVEELQLDLGEVTLPADLGVPEGATGVVVFAHGSGSSRKSPRNQQVAEGLRDAGFASLLFDLLTEAEAQDRDNVFDIPLLASRLAAVVDEARDRRELAELPVGLFGSSTGAAAALDAAVERPGVVGAVVSRGGRVDMASRLSSVEAPTLMLVGGRDRQVLELNEQASEHLRAEHELRVVEGAGHLFEGPGELEEVTQHAIDWFDAHLTS